MPMSRRALLNEGSRAVAVAGTAAVGLLAARTARPPADIDVAAIDEDVTVPTAVDDLLVVPENDHILVLSRRCTHLGCRLNVDEKAKGFVCPCHGSRFDLHGNRVAGPADSNLAVLKTIVR